jgi:hypothetical protein
MFIWSNGETNIFDCKLCTGVCANYTAATTFLSLNDRDKGMLYIMY